MQPFAPITLGWDGVEYVIPANRVLMAIATVESTITLQELAAGARTGNVPLAKLATAYAGVLRYAGANAEKVTPESVYAGMFGSAIKQEAVALATIGLINMMIPKQATLNTGAKKGNGLADAVKSSRKPTRPQLAANG